MHCTVVRAAAPQPHRRAPPPRLPDPAPHPRRDPRWAAPGTVPTPRLERHGHGVGEPTHRSRRSPVFQHVSAIPFFLPPPPAGPVAIQRPCLPGGPSNFVPPRSELLLSVAMVRVRQTGTVCADPKPRGGRVLGLPCDRHGIGITPSSSGWARSQRCRRTTP
jgi:hypothetical protein